RVAGPLLVVAAGNAFFVLDPSFSSLPPPAPGALLLAIILFSVLAGGFTAGLLTATGRLCFAIPFLSGPGRRLVMTPDHLLRFLVFVPLAFAIPIGIERLRQRTIAPIRRERAARAAVEALNRELSILRAAMDKVDYAVLLLDEHLRVRFMNEAF